MSITTAKFIGLSYVAYINEILYSEHNIAAKIQLDVIFHSHGQFSQPWSHMSMFIMVTTDISIILDISMLLKLYRYCITGLMYHMIW